MAGKDCVFCSAPITYAHLGVNCCRACAVFYKRAKASKDPLECINGEEKCIEQNARTPCRLCRFTNIQETLQRASDGPESIHETAHTSTFIDHESYYDNEPSTSRTPTLDRLRKGYSFMCIIRQAGETGIRTDNEGNSESDIQLKNLVLRPAAYSLQQRKICFEALKACLDRSFPDYRALDGNVKEYVSRSCFNVINSLDSSYRTLHHFPDDDQIRCPGYTIYLRPDNLVHLLSTNTNGVDSKVIADQVKNSVEMSALARSYYRQVRPTDYEFLALLGLIVWSEELASVNDELLNIATRNREAILRELHTYYAQQGTVNYAGRIGQLFCLLIHFQRSADSLEEENQLYQLRIFMKEHVKID